MKQSFKDKLLDPNSGVSSMRWALIVMTPIIKWMLITTPLLLVVEAIYNESGINWTGGAAYIGSLAAFFALLLGAKGYQKSNEK